jgi:DNA adenine methylase
MSTLPESISREEYSDVRDCYNNKSDKYPKWYVGAIGFLASYNGRFFDGGYPGTVKTKINTIRDYYDEAKRNLEKQMPNLNGIVWKCCDYKRIKQIERFVIYCDIPYKDVKQYNTSKNFNHNEFWQWVRDMSKNNIVIVSECQAPNDFRCIWEQEILRSIDNTKRVSSVEKLFTYDK